MENMEKEEILDNPDGRPLVRLSYLYGLVEGSRQIADRLPETARSISPESLIAQARRMHANFSGAKTEPSR